jgi:hypothetical protein
MSSLDLSDVGFGYAYWPGHRCSGLGRTLAFADMVVLSLLLD